MAIFGWENEPWCLGNWCSNKPMQNIIVVIYIYRVLVAPANIPIKSLTMFGYPLSKSWKILIAPCPKINHDWDARPVAIQAKLVCLEWMGISSGRAAITRGNMCIAPLNYTDYIWYLNIVHICTYIYTYYIYIYIMYIYYKYIWICIWLSQFYG